MVLIPREKSGPETKSGQNCPETEIQGKKVEQKKMDKIVQKREKVEQKKVDKIVQKRKKGRTKKKWTKLSRNENSREKGGLKKKIISEIKII